MVWPSHSGNINEVMQLMGTVACLGEREEGLKRAHINCKLKLPLNLLCCFFDVALSFQYLDKAQEGI